MSTYQYRPLKVDEIRLLELHSGKFDDAINISIFHTSFSIPDLQPPEEERLESIQETLPPGWRVHENLEGRLVFYNSNDKRSHWEHPQPELIAIEYDAHKHPIALCEPAFEALSYVWGDDKPSKPVHVIRLSRRGTAYELSSTEEEARILVRHNLYDALKHLRKHDISRFLWIDAISINQENINERNQQVRRMGDIYKFAKRVVVWLGPAGSGSNDAMRILAYIGEQVQWTWNQSVLPTPNCTEAQLHRVRDASTIEKSPETWLAVRDLLLRPWFQRLWIIQEIMLANCSAIVQCGDDIVLWPRMQTAIIMCSLLKFPDGSPRDLPLVLAHRRDLADPAEGRNPLRWFVSALGAHCSDPRDKIFALLGLLPPTMSNRIQPRYDKPVLDVYREAFQVYVDCTGSLAMLSFAGPSWVPDLSHSRGSLGIGGRYSTVASIAEVKYISTEELAVTGTLYDTVKSAAGPLPSDSSRIVRAARDLCLQDASTHSSYPTGISLAEACAWTLHRGRIEERWPGTGAISITKAMLPFLGLDDDHSFPKASDLETVPNVHITNGSFFRTANGYFGFACSAALPGDIICLLLGCPLPTILRRLNSCHFLFLGCAYIHGLMDGEALLGPLPNGCEVVVISDYYGHPCQIFSNAACGSRSTDDPRLGPLPPEWQAITTKDRLWSTKKVNAFRNKDTGEIIFSHPSLFPDALRARGVALQQITLCHQDTDNPPCEVLKQLEGSE